MSRQKSESSVVPQGRRKSSPTERARGGKGTPVNKEIAQLGLAFATAEDPQGAPKRGRRDLSRTTPTGVLTAKTKTLKTLFATLDCVVECLDEALDHVVRNKGAAGPNGRSVRQVQRDWPRTKRRLSYLLRSGSYQPDPIRRVEIPKSGGGVRGLGIPNVEDRVVQEAIRMCLEPCFEPGFHTSSHGFRPKRSCHTAIAEAQRHVEAGYDVVVDLDLSKFFDRVHHQRLMARVATKVHDRALLVVIGRLLKCAVVLSDGVVVPNDEGVPQGGPLSPLLSNIVLDELDWELDRRGHRFVRYADDVAIFVRSRRAADRVVRSTTQFIEGRMRLKVNAEKSGVRTPDEGNFLGFRLGMREGGTTEVLLSDRSIQRAKAKVRELTPRNWGSSFASCIAQVNKYFRGWFGYFGICSINARRSMNALDGRARRRLRAIKLKQWKTKRTIARKLNSILRSKTINHYVYEGRQQWWALSARGVVVFRLTNRWFREQGFEPLASRLEEKERERVAPKQTTFAW
jgi:RNA-directed DNA polymerase